MKRIDIKYLLQLLLITVAGGFLPMIVYAVYTLILGDGFVGTAGTFLFIIGSLLTFIGIMIFGKNMIMNRSVTKLELSFDERGFRPVSTFESSNATFYIDLKQGKVGVVSVWNPYTLQILNATELTNLYVSDGKMLGGTSKVSFCFTIAGTKWKVPTFTVSNGSYSMKSKEVIEAIEKANTQINMILQAQKNCN